VSFSVKFGQMRKQFEPKQLTPRALAICALAPLGHSFRHLRHRLSSILVEAVDRFVKWIRETSVIFSSSRGNSGSENGLYGFLTAGMFENVDKQVLGSRRIFGRPITDALHVVPLEDRVSVIAKAISESIHFALVNMIQAQFVNVV
jgi:hypothetical protein